MAGTGWRLQLQENSQGPSWEGAIRAKPSRGTKNMGSLRGEVLQVEGITSPKGLGQCWPVGASSERTERQNSRGEARPPRAWVTEPTCYGSCLEFSNFISRKDAAGNQGHRGTGSCVFPCLICLRALRRRGNCHHPPGKSSIPVSSGK